MWRTKQWWLDLAEIIDSLRIFPRLLLSAYMILVGYEVTYLTWWYANLESIQRTLEVTAFYNLIMGGLFGLAAYVFKVYSEGGRNWDKPTP